MVIAAFALIAYFVFEIKNASEENANLLAREQNLSRELEKIKSDLEFQTEYYRMLLYDDNFVARRIKEKFGYTGPNEITFKFTEGEPVKIEEGQEEEGENQ